MIYILLKQIQLLRNMRTLIIRIITITKSHWFLDILQLIKLCMYTQSCLTLCSPMNCSPPGSSVPGILQARILEWVAISSSRGSSQPRALIYVFCDSCIAGGFFTAKPPGKSVGWGGWRLLWIQQPVPRFCLMPALHNPRTVCICEMSGALTLAGGRKNGGGVCGSRQGPSICPGWAPSGLPGAGGVHGCSLPSGACTRMPQPRCL